MFRSRLEEEYFKWLTNFVIDADRYEYLFYEMYNTEFRYGMINDESRAIDGVCRRYDFALEYGYDRSYVQNVLSGNCNVLEMITALAIRCESIMDDIDYGDRTSQWFWEMLTSLRLSAMTNDRFDAEYVRHRLDIFMDRDHNPDGSGGLFRIKNCPVDLRKIEIWRQLSLYLEPFI